MHFDCISEIAIYLEMQQNLHLSKFVCMYGTRITFLASKDLLIYLVPMTIITGMTTMMIFNFLDNNHNMHVTE